MSKIKLNKNVTNKYKNHKLIVRDTENFISEERVLLIDEGMLETENYILPLDKLDKYYNESKNGITYIADMPFNEREYANQLKELRRSAVLHNITDYETDNKPNILSLILIIGLIVTNIF